MGSQYLVWYYCLVAAWSQTHTDILCDLKWWICSSTSSTNICELRGTPILMLQVKYYCCWESNNVNWNVELDAKFHNPIWWSHIEICECWWWCWWRSGFKTQLQRNKRRRRRKTTTTPTNDKAFCQIVTCDCNLYIFLSLLFFPYILFVRQ